jgi:hypothetical protein
LSLGQLLVQIRPQIRTFNIQNSNALTDLMIYLGVLWACCGRAVGVLWACCSYTYCHCLYCHCLLSLPTITATVTALVLKFKQSNTQNSNTSTDLLMFFCLYVCILKCPSVFVTVVCIFVSSPFSRHPLSHVDVSGLICQRCHPNDKKCRECLSIKC